MSNKSGVSEQVISLPNGGGALSGIGETFSADPHTGTGNFTVPIELPPGRNDFQPDLNLTYSTGDGNGPFGLGWQLSVPGVSRKTSTGVPEYDDERDTFILSGAEDLVPVTEFVDENTDELVTRYRPRTEGLFARIERRRSQKSDYWRVKSKDGLVSTYGTDPASLPPDEVGDFRSEADTATTANPANRQPIFAWHLTRTTDPFGNHIHYEYEHDSGQGQGHHWDQTYLGKICYVNYDQGGKTEYVVSVTFEYGAGTEEDAEEDETRPDPFSDYRAGFEIRTRKRCHGITIRTNAGTDRTVRRYHFEYLGETDSGAPLNGASMLDRIVVEGIDETADPEGEELPPLEFGYTRFDPDGRDFFPLTGPVPTRSLADPDLELADIFGNGLPDIVEMNGTVRYWRNLGGGRFDEPRSMRYAPPQAQLVDRGVQLIDANGDGRIDLLTSGATRAGYYPHQHTGEWDRRSFRPYDLAPSFDLEDPQVQLLDVDGDGVTDAVRSGTRLEYYHNDPEKGWTTAAAVPRRRLEEFPNVNFADQRLKWGDVSGDGLQDVLLVHDGNVEYWPNLGHGDWGRRISMRNCPRFPYGYDPKRILVGDVDGDGLADIVYVDHERVLLWINQSGNRWGDRIEIEGTPPVTDVDAVRLVDMLGTGIGGVLWSADVRNGRDNTFFLDFTGGVKPYLLSEMDNHMGATTRVGYRSSIEYYLADQRDPETRWQTTLPFPVQVVARVETIDAISENKLTTEYRYHHGYWDGGDREFRGFGYVEQFDTETFDDYHRHDLHGDDVGFTPVGEDDTDQFSPPTMTKTWFHQGPVGDEHGEWDEVNYRTEYWAGDPQILSSPADRQANLRRLGIDKRRDRRDALRALRGSTLRTELYALDGVNHDRPYTVTEASFEVEEKQPPEARSGVPEPPNGEDPRRIFWAYKTGERTTQWERGDDPMTQLAFTGDYDDYGQPRSQLAIAVPRGREFREELTIGAEVDPYLVTLARTEYVDPPESDDDPYIVDRVARTTTFEVDTTDPEDVFTLKEAIEADELPLDVTGQTVSFYDGAAFTGDAVGEIGEYGAVTRTETLVLTDAILSEGYTDHRDGYTVGDPVLPDDHPYFEEIGTSSWSGEYPDEFLALFRGSTGLGAEATDTTRPGLSITPLGYGVVDGTSSPFLPEGYYVATDRRKYDFHEPGMQTRGLVLETSDPRGARSSIEYDEYDFLPVTVRDAADLTTTAENDYRVLQPRQVTDPNGNETRVGYTPLGLPKSVAVMGSLQHSGTYEGDPPDEPGTILEYGFLAFEESPPEDPQPISVHTRTRIDHGGDEFIETREYSDGFGRLVQTRTQAEDDVFGDGPFGGFDLDADGEFPDEVERTSVSPTATPRVVVSGWQTYDNKGHVVEQYEPFFAEGWDYLSRSEAEAAEASAAPGEPSVFGVAVRTYYDPRGQAIRTVNPDGSEQRVIYGVPIDLETPDEFVPTPWEAYTYDSNDNAGRTHPSEAVRYDHHWNTPSSGIVDTLGRVIETVERTRDEASADLDEYRTRTAYDIRGNPLTIIDQLGRVAFEHVYELANAPLCIDSIDAGVRLIVRDVAGNEVERRDSKGALVVRAYDELNRPTHVWARDGESGSVTLRERLVYGDDDVFVSETDAQEHNLLGTLHRHYDEAGLVTVASYDFKGNTEEKARRVIADAVIPDALPIDWDAGDPTTLETRESALLEAETDAYESSVEYDALNRVTSMRYPEDVDGERKELQPAYNRAGALERVSLVRGGTPEPFVDHIAYDAKGQRTLVAYGNGVMTRYAYDPNTFRLARLRTETYERISDGYRTTSDSIGGDLFQNITYEYDLVGNVTSILDRTPGCGVENTLRGRNELRREFEYDPLYRLVHAGGRECTSLLNKRPMTDYTPCGHRPPGAGMPDINRQNAPVHTSLYWEQYEYDPAGNMTKMRHAATSNDRNSPDVRWTRSFGMGGMTPTDWEQACSDHVASGDDRWFGGPGNQLTNVGDDGLSLSASLEYDPNGNLTNQRTPAINLEWDYADRLQSYRNTADAASASTRAFYLYDAAGQRVKKVVKKTGRTEVTVYVDGVFEYHRLETTAETKESNTLHVMDDQKRIAMVRVGGPLDDSDISPAVQYRVGDHLESSTVVLDGGGAWVSTEEYSPYGETTFGGFARKRYCYSGKEHDEESGLYYFGARYYATWIARWITYDPAGPVDGVNIYRYVRNNPLAFADRIGLQAQPAAGGSGGSEPGAEDRQNLGDQINQILNVDRTLVKAKVLPELFLEISKMEITKVDKSGNYQYRRGTRIRLEKSGAKSENPNHCTDLIYNAGYLAGYDVPDNPNPKNKRFYPPTKYLIKALDRLEKEGAVEVKKSPGEAVSNFVPEPGDVLLWGPRRGREMGHHMIPFQDLFARPGDVQTRETGLSGVKTGTGINTFGNRAIDPSDRESAIYRFNRVDWKRVQESYLTQSTYRRAFDRIYNKQKAEQRAAAAKYERQVHMSHPGSGLVPVP